MSNDDHDHGLRFQRVRQPLYRDVSVQLRTPASMSFFPGGRRLTEEEKRRSSIDYAALVAFEEFLATLPPDPDCDICGGEGRFDPEAGACLQMGFPMEWCPCVLDLPCLPGTPYQLSCEVGLELDERDQERKQRCRTQG